MNGQCCKINGKDWRSFSYENNVQVKKKREEILMVQILYFIHIPTIKHFEFETIKKQQKEKR